MKYGFAIVKGKCSVVCFNNVDQKKMHYIKFGDQNNQM